jgi:hypothetical protein
MLRHGGEFSTPSRLWSLRRRKRAELEAVTHFFASGFQWQLSSWFTWEQTSSRQRSRGCAFGGREMGTLGAMGRGTGTGFQFDNLHTTDLDGLILWTIFFFSFSANLSKVRKTTSSPNTYAKPINPKDKECKYASKQAKQSIRRTQVNSAQRAKSSQINVQILCGRFNEIIVRL